MLYHRGKIRQVEGIVKIVKSNIVWNQIRESSQTRKETDFAKVQTEYTSRVIGILETSGRVKNEMKEFKRPTRYESFQMFPNQSLPARKVQPTTIPYETIKSLGGLMAEKKVKRAFELVLNSADNGVYLSELEFLSLFVQFSPFSWYAYKLLRLYADRVRFRNCKKNVLVLLIKVSASNFDYKLFDQLFQLYQQKGYIISDEILIMAIQVYMKTENVALATQLFNQQVMSSLPVRKRVLDVYISNMYNETKNVGMCMDAYRLWLSKSTETNISIDSFMYNLVYEYGDVEDLRWIESSLTMRGLRERFPIKFGALCNTLSKDVESYSEFMESQDYHMLKEVAAFEGEESLLINNLTYLHLRHREYDAAISSFEQVKDPREFRNIVYSVLRHFENEEKPEMIIEVLMNLKNVAGVDVQWRYLLIYWRCVIKKYPYLASKVHIDFIKVLKKSKYHRFSFLSKILRINPYPNKHQGLDMRDFPVINFGKIESDMDVLPAAPRLQNIESRLVSGILPNNEMLRKSIRFTNDRKEFDRLLEICNLMNPKELSVRLNIDIFYKECDFGNRMDVNEFVELQMKLINKRGKVEDKELCELFRLCYKYELYEESLKVMKMFQEFKVKIVGDQQTMKFLSIYVKWCFKNKKFQDLVLILEWLKFQDEFLIDGFFLRNLQTASIKFLNQLDKEIIDVGINGGLQFEELVHIREEVVPSVIGYYDSALEELKIKHDGLNKDVITNTRIGFEKLVKWVDEDTELMFDGEW